MADYLKYPATVIEQVSRHGFLISLEPGPKQTAPNVTELTVRWDVGRTWTRRGAVRVARRALKAELLRQRLAGVPTQRITWPDL